MHWITTCEKFASIAAFAWAMYRLLRWQLRVAREERKEVLAAYTAALREEREQCSRQHREVVSWLVKLWERSPPPVA